MNMVGLYEKDLPKLKKHDKRWPKPDFYVIAKQGRHGALTVEKWRDAIMEDWGKRFQWLK